MRVESKNLAFKAAEIEMSDTVFKTQGEEKLSFQSSEDTRARVDGKFGMYR